MYGQGKLLKLTLIFFFIFMVQNAPKRKLKYIPRNRITESEKEAYEKQNLRYFLIKNIDENEQSDQKIIQIMEDFHNCDKYFQEKIEDLILEMRTKPDERRSLSAKYQKVYESQAQCQEQRTARIQERVSQLRRFPRARDEQNEQSEEQSEAEIAQLMQQIRQMDEKRERREREQRNQIDLLQRELARLNAGDILPEKVQAGGYQQAELERKIKEAERQKQEIEQQTKRFLREREQQKKDAFDAIQKLSINLDDKGRYFTLKLNRERTEKTYTSQVTRINQEIQRCEEMHNKIIDPLQERRSREEARSKEKEERLKQIQDPYERSKQIVDEKLLKIATEKAILLKEQSELADIHEKLEQLLTNLDRLEYPRVTQQEQQLLSKIYSLDKQSQNLQTQLERDSLQFDRQYRVYLDRLQKIDSKVNDLRNRLRAAKKPPHA